MKKILDLLFLKAIGSLHNWVLWLILGALITLAIEGNSNDGFATSTLWVIGASIAAAVISVIWNLKRIK
ncbi:hypothetical protein [Adhaeribacter aquaticus]|uniref:hypothetical protein n=1 Tax=Adhaeribacter aquaticus TaxID=299567 RepID=UPI0003F8BACF|nr:hypothetical protein [Adhaeribacter aquaticus]